jgi:Integral membrane protein DUF92
MLSWFACPEGTNGGVTPLGLAASVAGGAFVGVVFYLTGLLSPTLLAVPGSLEAAARQWKLIPFGGATSTLGILPIWAVCVPSPIPSSCNRMSLNCGSTEMRSEWPIVHAN